MEEAGFDVVPFYVDISSRSSVLQLIEEAQKEGEISIFINAAGVSEVFFEAGASAFW
jgi:short-subunit dehydrogenase